MAHRERRVPNRREVVDDADEAMHATGSRWQRSRPKMYETSGYGHPGFAQRLFADGVTRRRRVSTLLDNPRTTGGDIRS